MDPSIIICPHDAVGHIIPSIILAKRIASHGVKVIYIFPGKNLYNKISNSHSFEGTNIELHLLEFSEEEEQTARLVAQGIRRVDVVDVQKGVAAGTARHICIRKKIDEIRRSSPSLIAAVFDYLLLDDALVQDPDLPVYAFVPVSAASRVAHTYVTLCTQSVEKIPGLPTLNWYDLDPILRDVNQPLFKGLKEKCAISLACQGLLFNTFEEMESGPLSTAGTLWKSVFPVGPLFERHGAYEDDVYSKWLNEQPANSVVFVCFGSWLQLSEEQMHELALGLELSTHRFLWVLSENEPNELPWLAEFKTRTEERGLIVTGWAPQQMILSHYSIGAFMMTSGWGSVLESLVLGGIPLITWPLFGDHHVTCRYLVDGVKIGVEVSQGDGVIVTRDEVAKAVMGAMDGREACAMRERAKELQKAAIKAVAQGGSSYLSLQAFVHVLQTSQK